MLKPIRSTTKSRVILFGSEFQRSNLPPKDYHLENPPNGEIIFGLFLNKETFMVIFQDGKIAKEADYVLILNNKSDIKWVSLNMFYVQSIIWKWEEKFPQGPVNAFFEILNAIEKVIVKE